MIPQNMVDWGSQGSVIREIAVYGDRRAQEVGAENVFNFTIGSPSVPAPACVAESIRRLLETVPAAELHGYTPAPGLASVRQKLADRLKAAFGVGYGPQDLYLTSGSSSALAILCYALLSPGDEILTLTPYFTEYRLYAQAAGATLVEVPSHPDTFQMELSAVERAITPRTAAMLLNSPNNPSGVILSRESLEQLAALLSEKARQFGHPIYVIADEPYRELSYGGAEVPFLPAIYPDAIYCYSFSKSLSLPGERIGYLALHPETTDYGRVRAAVYGAGRALGYINVSSLFQRVAADCAGQTADLSVYAENRDFIYAALTRMGFSCVRPDGAFYLFLKTPSDDSRFFCQKAMERDVLLIPGDEFGCPGYARLAYCVPPETLQRSLPAFQALAKDFGL